MKIYIAGPMTGIPDYNRPAFNHAAVQLATIGHEPINPATIPTTEGWQYGDYLRTALRMMLDADAVALLPGWYESRGALLEEKVASSVGMETRRLADWMGQ